MDGNQLDNLYEATLAYTANTLSKLVMHNIRATAAKQISLCEQSVAVMLQNVGAFDDDFDPEVETAKPQFEKSLESFKVDDSETGLQAKAIVIAFGHIKRVIEV
jgi:hypothetical protein